MQQPTVSAVIVAAGSSRRMGTDKLKIAIGGKTVLQRSFEAMCSHPYITEIVLVTGADDTAARALAQGCPKKVIMVRGGETRVQSALNGVQAAGGQYVAIHDAARPFVSEAVITQALDAAFLHGAAAPAVAVKDTIKVAGEGGEVLSTPARSSLFAVQTPQCFERAEYLKVSSECPSQAITDDCSLYELCGRKVVLTPGDYANYKITTKEDVQNEMQMRVGHGYDVHKLVEGRKLILGGADIPYTLGLLGHSDADVLLHAIMDAVLGAAALGDIGKHFPDTDPAYEGADSMELARHTAALVAAEGWQVANIDATILCQRPKLAPYIAAMRQNIADCFGLDVGAVSIKATTEEGLGFTGAGQGIAAHAVALISR